MVLETLHSKSVLNLLSLSC